MLLVSIAAIPKKLSLWRLDVPALRTYHEHNTLSLLSCCRHDAPGGREGRRRDRRTGPSPFGADAVRAASAEVPADIGQARHRLVERREAQRFGGKASHAFRSPHARASGRASQTRPNGPRKPIQARLRRQSGVTPGCHRGASQTPGASRRSIPLLGKRKKGPAVPTPR
jgi:hypothetical protein